MSKYQLPSQEYLKTCIEYNHETGKCFWKVRPIEHFKSSASHVRWNNMLSGKEIITKHGNKFCAYIDDKKPLNLTKIIIKIMTNSDAYVEYLDKNHLNNKWDNLKLYKNVEYIDLAFHKNILPSYAYLNECFEYNKDTGILRWNFRPPSHFKSEHDWEAFNTIYHGEILDKIVVSLGAIKYHKNSIIYKMITGEDHKLISHLDNDKLNFKWDNLVPESSNNVVNFNDGGILPSQEFLKECLEYDKISGKCYWKIRPRNHFKSDAAWRKFNSANANNQLGISENYDRYYTCTIDWKVYNLHHIIVKLLTNIDQVCVYHLDGNILNNCWDNLYICQTTNTVEFNQPSLDNIKFKNIKPLPSQQYLNECFSYNSISGELFWKVRPMNHFKSLSYCEAFNNLYANKIATWIKDIDDIKNTYLMVSINRKPYRTSRIIWKMLYGYDPKEYIDHKDNNGLNNALDNLREATAQQNSHNLSKQKQAAVPHKGVFLGKTEGTFYAALTFNRKSIYLGTYDNVEDAKNAYDTAAKKYYKEFFNAGYNKAQ